jgi:hypothetical protein
MTYYKYVSREGADVVDWGAITKSVSESLGQVAKDREAKREAIDEASRKTGETLANAPMGESKTINDFTIEYANNAEKYRLMQDRLLRSGQMSLKDYNLGRANLTSGTTELFNLSKEYNAVYADKMERMNKTESSLAEPWAMGNIEGYSNFSKSSAYIDPTNGRVAVGMKVKKTLPDGKEVFELSDNPNDLKSVNELRNIIDTKYDRFKISQNLQPGVDELSKTIKVLMEDGVKTREDARQNDDYLDSRNTFINSFIKTNPDIPMSVLVDYLGVVPDEKGNPTDVSFELTYDPKEAATSDNFILMEPNENTGRYEANLTKSQEEMARKALTARFEAMVDRVDTAMPTPKPPSAYEQRTETQRKIDTQNATSWGQLYYGTPEQQKQAADRLLASPIARKEDLIDIDVRTEPGKVILRYKDSTKDRKIDILDDAGNPMPYADFVSLGNELHGIDDYGRALQLSGREDATYNIDRKGRATRAGKANFYSDPETLVTFEGEKNVTPKSIIEKIPSEIDEDTIKTVSNVFSVLNLPKPTITTKEGGQDIPKEPTMADYSGLTFAEKTKPSIEITFPGVSPINIPEGDDFPDTLSKIMEVLDSSFKSNVDISIDEIKAAFPTLEIFELYNPGFATTEETTPETPTKRSVNQIMKDEGVSRVEAVKIFKEQ